MLSPRESKSVVSMLRDRELSIKRSPYFTSLKIANEIIRSDKKSLYTNIWTKRSQKEISYDSGNLYFMNYSQYLPINASNLKAPPFHKMEKSSHRKKRISDAISYSGTSVCKDIANVCVCKKQRCTCLSQYLLSISEDNWLCQHSVVNGKIMKQMYVNAVGRNVKFRYCDWDVYGERFVLTTIQTPCTRTAEKSNTPFYIAVFTTFPIEFCALMEIKRSVFGSNLTAVSISNRSLIIGLGAVNVEIYNFDDFLKGGTLTPYKLGDLYENRGEIGSYPTGLPLNFSYKEAPPVLFNVTCLGQIVRFGGFPYCYITIHHSRCCEYSITSVETGIPIIIDDIVEQGIIHDPIETAVFHPDQSNRIVIRKDSAIDVYKLAKHSKSGISKMFSMGLLCASSNDSGKSSFGRTIKRRKLVSDSIPCSVLCSDYDDELNIFAVLTKYSEDSAAYVLLYDSVSGKELRAIKVSGYFDDCKMYQIFIDLYTIIIIEKDFISNYTVYVAIM